MHTRALNCYTTPKSVWGLTQQQITRKITVWKKKKKYEGLVFGESYSDRAQKIELLRKKANPRKLPKQQPIFVFVFSSV